MKDAKDFESRFTDMFQPIFFWGVGALELTLILYTLYMELMTGSGPSLLTTILPLSVAIAILWAVLAALITLARLGVEKRRNRSEHEV